MQDYLADNGQAMFRGDQSALGGYAQFDPQGALSLYGQHQAMDFQRQANDRADAQLEVSIDTIS